jgi:hypothetical protein
MLLLLLLTTTISPLRFDGAKFSEAPEYLIG